MNQAMTQPASSALCAGCGTEVAAGLLACPVCHKLVHGAELARLASEAREAEERGDFTAALGTWRKTLELLPQGTAQRTTIDAQMKRLSAMLDGRAPKPQPKNTGKKAGAVATTGAVGAALLKSKAILAAVLANGKFLLLGLLKLPTLLSMVVFSRLMGGLHSSVVIGFVAAMYVHEVGHVATLRRYGIAASAPMFVPGFGALVRLHQYPTDAHEEARTGLAGPLWGLVASAFALVIGAALHSPTALTVASWSGTLNMFNLTPVWQLDGGRGLKALSRSQRALVGLIAIGMAILTFPTSGMEMTFMWWLEALTPGTVGVLVLGRAFVGASHPTGDRGMFALFASLVVLLPAVAWMANLLRVGL